MQYPILILKLAHHYSSNSHLIESRGRTQIPIGCEIAGDLPVVVAVIGSNIEVEWEIVHHHITYTQEEAERYTTRWMRLCQRHYDCRGVAGGLVQCGNNLYIGNHQRVQREISIS